jgi:hypothetical protein
MTSDGPPDQADRRQQMLADDKCHKKAVDKGMLRFTLIESDPTAADTILAWIGLNLHTAPIPKLCDAFEKCLAMLTPQVEQKHAD